VAGAGRLRSARRLSARGALITTVLLAGCGSATHQGTVQRTASPVIRMTGGGAPAHIAVVVMENEEYDQIVGSSATPYINRLARRYALATTMFAITHPSLPNYLAMTGGSSFGIDSDCTDCSVHATGLADQLAAAHLQWKAYMEDLPRPCFRGAQTGDYAKKHDPFIYYTTIAGRPAQCANIVPLRELAGDERSHRLPRFVWITPNLCHDMHDCAPPVGDRFLSHLLPPLLGALGPRGVLVLTWDEGTTDDGCCRLASGGHIATIVAGPGARPGARLSTPSDGYSILQTIEDLLHLPRLRGAACVCTPSLAPLMRGIRTISGG
jgi:phosphatidylinositol-3-phosphatase